MDRKTFTLLTKMIWDDQKGHVETDKMDAAIEMKRGLWDVNVVEGGKVKFKNLDD